MAADEAQRKQLLQQAIARCTGAPADVAVQLLQMLGPELISIIGENGFSALHLRSLHLTRVAFPWLAAGGSGDGMARGTPSALAPREIVSADARYTDLRLSLQERATAEANEATLVLFMTFTDILASLIGEAITIDILRAAWDDETSASDLFGKEISNE